LKKQFSVGKAIHIAFCFIAFAFNASAQPYTLLIKNGYLIDPKNNLHDTLDIAIAGNRIARIGKHLDPHQAQKVIDARGAIITPGLIDIHTHVFFGADPDRAYDGGPEGVVPDSFTFRCGVTTIADAGSSGCRDFPVFKRRVIDRSKTRVLAFLNIVGAGMRGNPYEQDTTDMKSDSAAAIARKYPQDIVGFKVAHYNGGSWRPVDEAVKAGRSTHRPVMIDFGSHLPPLSIKSLFFDHLRPGDILTHCFAQLSSREPIVDPSTGSLKTFIPDAQKKGIVFDVGYGEISFAFSQAIPAIKAGFLPNSISSDIHKRNIRSPANSLPGIMSKFLAMGVDLPTVIRMTTCNPAREIGHEELGQLSTGAIADLAILRIDMGQYTFFDHTGAKLQGNQKLKCEMTIKGGKIVYTRRSPISPRHR
jgi:dihydroorotase